MSAAPLDHARAHAARGWSTFPLYRPDDLNYFGQWQDGKKPSIPSWEPFQQYAASDLMLRCWFSGVPRNIGIVCGAVSGIVVIDLDSPEALAWARAHLPPTPWIVRTARGQHWYYTYPPTPVASRDLYGGRTKLLEIKSDGRYVVGPGSVHWTGVVYEAGPGWDAPRSAVPMWDDTWVCGLEAEPVRTPTPVRTPSPSRRTSPIVRRALIDRARRYLRNGHVPPPVIGQWSDKTVFDIAAVFIRDWGMNSEDAITVLWEWCGNRDGWDIEWVASKIASAAKRR